MESFFYIRFLKKRDSKNFKRWLAMFAAVVGKEKYRILL